MKNREQISIADKYGPAMKITDQAEADAYFAELVKHNLSFGKRDRAEAEKMERSNLGYFAGYSGNETRKRVEQLFKCEHPIFGSIAKNGPPTQREAFLMGAAMGAGVKLEIIKGVTE